MSGCCTVCGRCLSNAETLINSLPDGQKMTRVFHPPLRTIFIHVTRFDEVHVEVEVPENCIISTHDKYNIVDIPQLIEAMNAFYATPVTLKWMKKTGVLRYQDDDVFGYIKSAIESITQNKPTKRGNLIGDARFLERFVYRNKRWFILCGS